MGIFLEMTGSARCLAKVEAQNSAGRHDRHIGFYMPEWPFAILGLSLILLIAAVALWINRPDGDCPERRHRYRVIAVLLVLALVVLPLIVVCFADRR